MTNDYDNNDYDPMILQFAVIVSIIIVVIIFWVSGVTVADILTLLRGWMGL